MWQTRYGTRKALHNPKRALSDPKKTLSNPKRALSVVRNIVIHNLKRKKRPVQCERSAALFQAQKAPSKRMRALSEAINAVPGVINDIENGVSNRNRAQRNSEVKEP